ncbi:hypothetical protein HaLaN_11379 [Haematococcus lacustris]|uniref:Uncharacterized protein n=1 Tax=Haematococcus lacustris TaxID=44745 RepID=A0A699Z107_HAELA|nr:hypothetical protein HaLaN_11379 [Haematococcus lacustris]
MDVPHSIDCQSPGLDAGVGLLELRLHLRGAAAASRLLDCLQQPAGDLGASLATALNAPCGATLLLYATLSPPAAASAHSSALPVDTAPGHSSATPLGLACVLEQDPSLLPPGGSISRTLDVPAMCCGVAPGGPPAPEDSSSFEPSYPGASEESSEGSSDDGLPVEVSVYEASDESGYVTKHQSDGDHSSGSSSGSTSVQEVGSEAVPGFFDWMTWLTVSLSSPLSCGEVALQLLDLVAKEGGLPALLDPGLGGVLDMWVGDNIACDSIRRGTFRDTTLDSRHTFAALSLALATPQNAALDTERLASQQAQLVPAPVTEPSSRPSPEVSQESSQELSELKQLPLTFSDLP